MARINLKQFEKKIRLRRIALSDLPVLVEMGQRCFPGMTPWKRDQLESMLRMFPEGQLCIQYGKKVVASSSSLVVDFSKYTDWHNWKEISDNGHIRNHDPKGDTLYGIEIMVDPDYRGLKLARRLYEARKQVARDMNLQRIIVGGRIPGYGKVADRMSARAYVDKVMEKSLVDPVLTTQLSNGFTLRRIIPDYMPADVESRGYATFLEWTNLDHQADGASSEDTPAGARTCVVQYLMRKVKDFKDFAGSCEYFIDVASDYRSDFIVFPELFTTQLLSTHVKPLRPGIAARRLSEFTPQYLDLFTKMAIKYNVNIIGGSQFTEEDGKLYNISYLFRRDGTLGKQYKIHITPNEKRWWGVSPGDRVEVFDTDRGKIAILICYDIEFPELSRIAAKKGAQILFVPFNTDERYGYLRVRNCAQARCIENHVYVVLAGCVGNLPHVENMDVHYAKSGIYTPADFPFDRDAVAAECADNIETVILHDLDLSLLGRQREKGTVRNWHDRRTDLYRIRYKEGQSEHDL